MILRALLQVARRCVQARRRCHRQRVREGRERMQARWPRQPALRSVGCRGRAGLALPLAATAAVLLLVIVTNAARTSAPGDLAYPLRRLTETAALRLTVDPAARAARHLEQAGQRLAEAKQLWQADRTSAGALLAEGVNQMREALTDLAQATDDFKQARRVLTELVAVSYEARSWVLSVFPDAPAGVRGELEAIAAQLAIYEHWAQAGLLDLASLAGLPARRNAARCCRRCFPKSRPKLRLSRWNGSP